MLILAGGPSSLNAAFVGPFENPSEIGPFSAPSYIGPFELTSGTSDKDSVTFAWFCESSTLGADDYSAGDTTATLSSATISADSDYSGTYGLEIDGAYHIASFDISNADVVSEGVFGIGMWVRINTWGNTFRAFTIQEDGTNYINMNFINSDEVNVANYNDSGNQTITTIGANLALSTWYFIMYVCDSDNNWHGIYVYNDSDLLLSDVIEYETLYPLDLTTSTEVVHFGSNSATVGDIDIDVIIITDDPDVDIHQWAEETSYDDF
jgi:hypothetical protein